MKYDHEILLLQGGGALGAYQAGVYEGLVEAGIEPSWVVGISIGAINAALIVGNPPERRVERLREFWRRIAVNCGPPLPAWLNSFRRPSISWPQCQLPPSASQDSTATNATSLVRRGRHRGALSIYDTTPLKATLEELVDFDLINDGQVRLSLGAVNVCKGTSTYIDTKNTLIHSDHVRASGALPPGFAPVMMNAGEHYWDGGVVTNTPITYVVDERPLTTARIIQVDTFNAEGELPRNLGQVLQRAKDIQYSAKSRFNIERIQEIGSSLRRPWADRQTAARAEI